MDGNVKDVVCRSSTVSGRNPVCGNRVVGAEVEGSGSISPSSCSCGRKNEQPKMCRCGMGKCKILTSKKDISRGRMFYCCPLSTGANNHGCGMFEWVSDVGGDSTGNYCPAPAVVTDNKPSPDQVESSSSYARGYLDGAIRGSEQQTHVLKSILDAITKLDVNKK